MTFINDTLLSAYIDNELSPEDRKLTEDALAESDTLRQRLEILKGSDLAMRETFTELDNTPMPDGLEALIRGEQDTATEHSSSNVVPLRRKMPAATWGVAASVILGVVLFLQSPEQLTVSDELNQFANNATSGNIIDGDNWRAEMVMSFEKNDGKRCREVRQHTPEMTTTLQACGAPNNWQWQVVEQDTLYHTATDESAVPVNALSVEEEQRWLGLKN